ncbi:metallo-beta-lactamase superfamily hydrolase [Treponema primitia ZAS-2]|uniref:Metallo-beta-lactamase superfamily hydrolase n=1 Tax=Treponema primitia (strain ATCC BAA-887 / DSM 12427 / ZAS-2) TaxID=545694 RepID=F5YPQ1_TREPZ|nr:MBL fold metallo-hydrolase [Treponema primitia]AEF85202.1 metallo-beta-lactamase superfamily hydrolase [Treponema primitia ZAS-2]
MKIAEGIYSLDCAGHGHVFYLEDEQTLIDTGMPNKGRRILKELSRLGIKPEGIKRIFLTHHDVDHAGNVRFLEEKAGAEIFIGKEDLPYLMNQRARPGIKKYLTKLLGLVPPKHAKTFEVMGNSSGIQTYYTPGHTPGHHVFLYGGILFAGDLFRIEGDRVKAMNPKMNWNGDILGNSISLIKEIPFTVVCPSHGNPMTREKMLPLIEELGGKQP